MARLAIAKGFVTEYAKLEKGIQNAVESAIIKFAEYPRADLLLEKPEHGQDDRSALRDRTKKHMLVGRGCCS